MHSKLDSARPWALVTGGSHGIGRALTLELLHRDINVAVVALPDENLEDLRREYRDVHGIHLLTLGINLVTTGATDRVETWLATHGITLTYLLNNAGFGRGGLIEHTPWPEYRTMLQLNNQVMVDLCYRFLEQLKQTGGAILNMSSMEATLPLPYKTVYTGTKAFVFSFSLALRQELRYHGVGLTVLCPGPVITNEDGMRRVRAQGARAKLLVKFPNDIAPEAIDGLLSGKDVVRPGWLVRALILTSYVTPRRLRMRILERLFSKYREDELPLRVATTPLVVEERLTE